MGKGKFHHRGARGQEDDHGGILNLDADAPYRTHLLFPGRKDDADMAGDPRRGGSQSFMKQMLTWGKKPSESRPPNAAEMQRYRDTPEIDPYFRNKQVSFIGDNDCRTLFERPERKPNCYTSDPQPGQADRLFSPFNEPFRESDFLSSPSGPGGPGSARSGHHGGSSQLLGGGSSSGKGGAGGKDGGPNSGIKGVSGLLAAVGGQAAAAATGGNLTRAPACDPFASNGRGPPRSGDGRIPPGGQRGPMQMSGSGPGGPGPGPGGGGHHPLMRGRGRGPRREGEDMLPPKDLTAVSKDCFIIPQHNLERFLPDGITVRKENLANQILFERNFALMTDDRRGFQPRFGVSQLHFGEKINFCSFLRKFKGM